MGNKEIERLTALFKEEVSDKAKKIDPNNYEDWYSLTLGWAIAKVIDIKKAHKFARHIRNNTNLA